MPPVACSGCGIEGVQMLFRSPTIPLEPAEHRLSRPPMSPMPGTWQTPPGTAGVRLTVSLSGDAVAWVAWVAVVAVVAPVAVVAASAGVAIARPATASSSTRINQRDMRRPGEAESARSRPAGSGEAGELAILRELLVLRLRRRFRRSRAGQRRADRRALAWRGKRVRTGFPACSSRVRLAAPGPGDPGWVGVDPVPQLVGDQVDPDPPGPVIQIPVDALAVAERAKHGLVLVRGRDPEQRHDVRYLPALGRAECEHSGQAVGHLLVQQVTGVLRDQDQRGVP